MRSMQLGALGAQVYTDPAALGDALAGDLLVAIARARDAGRPFVLGCPSGRSLKSTYDALGRRAARDGADLAHVVIALMDEYLARDGERFALCPADAHYSCRGFAEREIRAVLNAGLPDAKRVPAEQLVYPHPDDPPAYEARLARDGVDVFLVASGASDGHVAFNPPGTALDSTTRIVALAETTRRDNMTTFPAFTSLAEVPTHGVGVGLGTIARHARAVAMVIHGAHKASAVRRLAACPDFEPDWPATVIYRCRDASIHLDEAAAIAQETRA